MKIQWNLLLALIFALIVAVFAVVNVEPARMDYVFGTAELPLIIIILASALLGGFIIASIGLFRNIMLQRKIKQLTKEKTKLEKRVQELTKEKISLNHENTEEREGNLSIGSGSN